MDGKIIDPKDYDKASLHARIHSKEELLELIEDRKREIELSKKKIEIYELALSIQELS